MFISLPDGGRLAYREQGRGPPLLLLRPLGGSLVSWDRFAELLADSVRVIAFDPRGVGRSSPAPLLMSTRQMARDARALLRGLGLSSAHVYGISLGGMVASWLSIDTPECVQKLVLASTLPRGLSAHAPRNLAALARSLLHAPAETEAELATRILSPQFRATHPDRVRRIQELARQHPATHRALATLCLAALRHDARRELFKLHADTLVLIGEYDPILTVDSQRVLLGALPHAQYALIERAGHDLSVEAPEQTAARVLAHVA
jgi:pimeloyl-ACP methyl ester carboxylesterase